MADNNKMAPVPLSELPEIANPAGFWIFGSKTESDGSFVSGKYLFENLAEYAKQLQLERRLAVNMGMASPYEMFIGEAMTIYRVEGKYITKLWINDKEVPFDQAVSVKILPKTMVTFKVDKEGTEPTGHLFIYAKATLP